MESVDSGVAFEGRKIQLDRLSHVYYEHKGAEKQRAFLEDFGFVLAKEVGKKAYYRGYGDDPWVYCLVESDEDRFGGAGFVVESEEDLEYAAQTLPGASKVYELNDAPGGGKCVTFKDPVDGFPVHLVYGQTPSRLEDEPSFPKIDFNFVSSLLTSQYVRFPRLIANNSQERNIDLPTKLRG